MRATRISASGVHQDSCPRLEMEQAKEIVRSFNQSEVLHLLNYIFKTRDDVLFLYAMTRQEINMDEENLRDFKKWLTENRDIVMACIESALPSVPTDGSASDVSGDEDLSITASVGSGSNAAGGHDDGIGYSH